MKMRTRERACTKGPNHILIRTPNCNTPSSNEPRRYIEKHPESGKGNSALKDKASIDSIDLQTLPFVKKPYFWETIESMEVFQRMPQRPHFQPLEHVNKDLRQGLAIGHMITFSNVVERVSKLQFDDANSISNEILEILSDLERHGFDVTTVRDCVTKLLSVRDEKGKIVDEVTELKSQISLQNGESSKIEKEMLELEEKLSSAISAKRKRDDEIGRLKFKLLKSERSLKDVEHKFEIAAAPTRYNS